MNNFSNFETDNVDNLLYKDKVTEKPPDKLVEKNENLIVEERKENIEKNLKENNEEEEKNNEKSDDKLLSFGEYTDKIIHESKSYANGDKNENKNEEKKNLESKRSRFRSNFNFASSKCGAQIINSSKRSKHISEILIDNPDTYALFPCIKSKSPPLWFIIQLCEPIRIQSVYLSNMELFSSYVKTFRISVTNHELTSNDGQWSQLEENFTVANGVKSQLFILENLNIASDLYTRYIRVEIIEHHDLSFFCPISTFKVYGVSLVNELSGPSIDDDDSSHNFIDENINNEEEIHFETIFYFITCINSYFEIFVKTLNHIFYNFFDFMFKFSFYFNKSPTLMFIYKGGYKFYFGFLQVFNYLILKVDYLNKFYLYIFNYTHVYDDINNQSIKKNIILNKYKSKISVNSVTSCIYRAIKDIHHTDMCCSLNHVNQDNKRSINYDTNKRMNIDCTVCFYRKKYSLIQHGDIIQNCLDDFCDNFCQVKDSTAIVLYNFSANQIIKPQNYIIITNITNITNTENIKNTINITNTINTINTTNELSKNITIEKVTINGLNETLNKNIPNLSIENETIQTNLSHLNQSYDNNFNETHYNYSDFENIYQKEKDIQNDKHVMNKENITNFETNKEKVIIRDDNPFGYISRIRKNLTVTMNYLNEMSIKFKKSLDEVKKQVSKVSEEKDLKIYNLNKHIQEILNLSNFYNTTLNQIMVEVNILKNATFSKNGLYFNISFFDSIKFLIYLLISNFILKLLYKCSLILLSFIVTYFIPKIISEYIYKFYKKYFYKENKINSSTLLEHYIYDPNFFQTNLNGKDLICEYGNNHLVPFASIKTTNGNINQIHYFSTPKQFTDTSSYPDISISKPNFTNLQNNHCTKSMNIHSNYVKIEDELLYPPLKTHV